VLWLCRLRWFRRLEAEIGDALEEYAAGKSAAWLWIQVFSLARIRRPNTVLPVRRAEMFWHLLSDVRYGLRGLRHNAGFTAAAVLTIALGIGMNTGVFSIFNGVVLRRLPVPEAGNLVSIYQNFRGVGARSVHGARSLFSASEYRTYRDATQTLSGIMGYSVPSTVTLGGDSPREVLAVFVTCNYFDVLQVKPELGGGFTAANCDDPAGGPVAVLTRDLWVNSFASDPNIAGRNVTLNGISFTVAGVAPEGFRGTEIIKPSLFVPVSIQPALLPPRDFYHDDTLSWLTLIGRRRERVGIEQVRADLSVIAARIDQQQPGRTTTLMIDRAAAFSLPEGRRDISSVARVVMAAFALVLLIACANVANLMLARGAARAPEISVRLSLGATRRRLIQQLLTESLLIAIAGGVLGSLLAMWSFRFLVAFVVSSLPGDIPPIAIDSNPDLNVLGFALAITLAAGLIFGLVPALQATRADLASTLKRARSGYRASRLLRAGLLSAQVAVCMLLLIPAALLMHGLYAAQIVEPGFAFQNVTVVSVDLRGANYDGEKAAAFRRALMDRAAALPGVDSVAQAARTPLSPGRTGTMFRLPERQDMNEIDFNVVSSGYFSLVEIPIVRGHAFSDAESQKGSDAVILTEATARRFWPGEDPVGKTLIMGRGRGQSMPLTIVGIAKDAQIRQVGEIPSSYMYLPSTSDSETRLTLLIRSNADFVSTAASVRALAQSLDPLLVFRVNRLEENLNYWQTMSGLATSLSTSLAVLALVIASIGLYGVVSYIVSRRVREVGIRMALGATAGQVQGMILKQAMWPVVIGAAVGIAGAAAVSRILEAVLFGVSAFDPIAFIAAPLFLFGVAIFASLAPARRAARVDPMATLRYE
jgi:predicted permease